MTKKDWKEALKANERFNYSDTTLDIIAEIMYNCDIEDRKMTLEELYTVAQLSRFEMTTAEFNNFIQIREVKNNV